MPVVCLSLYMSAHSLPSNTLLCRSPQMKHKEIFLPHILMPSYWLEMRCIMTVTSRIKTRVATLDLILGGSKHWALIISLVHIWSDACCPGTIPLLLIRDRTCSLYTGLSHQPARERHISQLVTEGSLLQLMHHSSLYTWPACFCYAYLPLIIRNIT